MFASRPNVCNSLSLYPSNQRLVLIYLPSFCSDQGKIPAPGFHAFTGTEFTTPEAMHSALWLAVTGNNEVEEGINIEKKLSAKLKYRQKTPTVTSPMLVVVLDEIDQLLTQNRQVLRKLFEWADAPKSRLVSLPEALLHSRPWFMLPSAKSIVSGALTLVAILAFMSFPSALSCLPYTPALPVRYRHAKCPLRLEAVATQPFEGHLMLPTSSAAQVLTRARLRLLLRFPGAGGASQLIRF